MSKLGCVCGHTIADTSDNISYKAVFYRDQDLNTLSDEYASDIDSFIEAIKNNRREDWIRAYFSDRYPVDLLNSSIIVDIISKCARPFESDIYQCEHCGRIKIQVQDKNRFTSFLPEDDHHRDIFKSFRKAGDAT
ncbi:hypothetical protein [Paraflavitalea sp. CAU 1676]|uniref:hypothetical protein n=1 Tax=Paraflavitalea sp. CAU 1676 TaxID=3032598 RepID=UPI0023DB2452|nr:hypothetical protein [Paraflavitalea sp. CAU 1676]MDF2188412.1 hypothetical protein [Paraflavitalea sp. CAU 1676]